HRDADRPALPGRQGPGDDRGLGGGGAAPVVRRGERSRAQGSDVRLFRGSLLDTPADPFRGGALRAETDGGLVVDDDGTIAARGSFGALSSAHPDAEVVDLSGGLVLPGLVDTHVHFPQLRCIGALGMPLLEWLDRCALPEEAHLADPAYAGEVASAF